MGCCPSHLECLSSPEKQSIQWKMPSLYGELTVRCVLDLGVYCFRLNVLSPTNSYVET